MLKSNESIKGQLSLQFYQRELVNGETQETTMFVSLRGRDILNVDDFLKSEFQKLVLRESLKSPDAGSGWSLIRCNQLTLKLNKNNFLNAGSYIELAPIIKNKKACINFENKDEYCIINSIRCAIDVYNKSKLNHPERVNQYEKYVYN